MKLALRVKVHQTTPYQVKMQPINVGDQVKHRTLFTLDELIPRKRKIKVKPA